MLAAMGAFFTEHNLIEEKVQRNDRNDNMAHEKETNPRLRQGSLALPSIDFPTLTRRSRWPLKRLAQNKQRITLVLIKTLRKGKFKEESRHFQVHVCASMPFKEGCLIALPILSQQSAQITTVIQ